MGDCDTHNKWNSAGIYSQLPEFASFYSLHFQGDCLQQIRNFVSCLLQRCYSDAFEAVSGIWLSAAEAFLSTNMVYGSSGSYFHRHHHNGYCCTLCQEQELQVQTWVANFLKFLHLFFSFLRKKLREYSCKVQDIENIDRIIKYYFVNALISGEYSPVKNTSLIIFC